MVFTRLVLESLCLHLCKFDSFSATPISPWICQVSSFQTSVRQILDLAVLQALRLSSIIQFASFLSVVVGLHLLFYLQVHQFFLVASILILCQLFNFLCLLDFFHVFVSLFSEIFYFFATALFTHFLKMLAVTHLYFYDTDLNIFFCGSNVILILLTPPYFLFHSAKIVW